jgi:hypothetical protein
MSVAIVKCLAIAVEEMLKDGSSRNVPERV